MIRGESMEIPKEVEQDIIQYQALQNQLAALQAQRARIEADLRVIDEALRLLEDAPEDGVYKIAGTVMVKANKAALMKELQEKKEALDVKRKSIAKREDQIRNKLLALKKKIEQALSSVGAQSGEPPAPAQ